MQKDLNTYLVEMEKIMAERRSKLKSGPNVIQLRYLSQHISPAELAQLETETEALGLQLSAMDRSGIMQNSISSLSGDLVLMLTEPGITGILLSGLMTNGLYDGLKALIISFWSKVNGKQTVSQTARTIREHPASFNLSIKIDENRSVELKTENLDEKALGVALDKISDIVKDLGNQKNTLMLFDPLDIKWTQVMVDIDYLKQHQKLTREIPLEEYLEELRRKESGELK
ncbi:MAG: hypothetical protein EOO45_02845 [Flavobacterium sp.]|nr:MAG: hypothetical protein EOO45_02845 [Flavobacterium sp.]